MLFEMPMLLPFGIGIDRVVLCVIIQNAIDLPIFENFDLIYYNIIFPCVQEEVIYF